MLNFKKPFLEHLAMLCANCSVFSEKGSLNALMDIVLEYSKECLQNSFNIYRDRSGNLIAVPYEIDLKKPIVILSAHIDTVDADESLWDSPFLPFSPYEDKDQIVARGVSDCKAGVALEMTIMSLIKNKEISPRNLVFTFTLKEEGAGEKTATEIGFQLGKKLPLSEDCTYIIPLENTVSVTAEENSLDILSVYTRERGNFVVEIEGTLSYLKNIVERLKSWNPVSISPSLKKEEYFNGSFNTKKYYQEKLHVCSSSRDENILTKIILNANPNRGIMLAGNRNNFGTLPDIITVVDDERLEPGNITHKLIVGKRNFDTISKTLNELEGIEYNSIKEFAISAGFNSEDKYESCSLRKSIQSVVQRGDCPLKVVNTFNVGASDGTIIFNKISPEFQLSCIPLVFGPGTRSQKHLVPARFTHGKNETFDKSSGLAALGVIIDVLIEHGNLNYTHPKSKSHKPARS